MKRKGGGGGGGGGWGVEGVTKKCRSHNDRGFFFFFFFFLPISFNFFSLFFGRSRGRVFGIENPIICKIESEKATLR